MSITKVTKPAANYHQLTQADLINGDILDVYSSLGLRCPHSVTVEALIGTTVVRFNVCENIYKEFDASHNSFVGLGQGYPRSSSYLLDEIKIPKDNVTITAGSTQTWTGDEISIKDIEFITVGASVKITIT